MYSIKIGRVAFQFEAILSYVESAGSFFEFELVEVDFSIHKFDNFSVISPLPLEKQTKFTPAQCLGYYGRDIVIKKSRFHSEDDLEKYFKSEVKSHDSDQAVDPYEFTSYPWGVLASLHWFKLGYEPGPSEFWLIPNIGGIITIGNLRFDYEKIQIEAVNM